MGWFSSSAPDAALPAPKPSSDGAYVAPDRNARQHCWEARDTFFACLDRNGIIDSMKDQDKAGKACGGEGLAFERNCASSWVQYFKKRRVTEHTKEETLKRLQAEGATRMPDGAPMPGSTLPSNR